MKARLILQDGRVFEGQHIGATGTAFGEVVFNTAMSGYQEALTDPSYYYHLIAMTYPQIGNVGINSKNLESKPVCASGLIIREYSPIVSNWQATLTLDEFLIKFNIVGISEIDTRALTRHIRDKGTQMGMITTETGTIEEMMAKLNAAPKLIGTDLVNIIGSEKTFDYVSPSLVPPSTKKVALLNFGAKYSIAQELSYRGCAVRIFPATTSAKDILAYEPNGIFLANGPGDPEPLTYAVNTIKDLLGKKPMFGLCLGHQLLALALGAKITKLKFGHHGSSHSVKNLKTNRVEMTAQNHGFVIDETSLPNNVTITHLNLNDNTIEGIACENLSAFSVQYHIGSAPGPGPHDSEYLFDQFIQQME